MAQDLKFVVTLRNFPEEIGLELSEDMQKNLLMLMLRNGIPNLLQTSVINNTGKAQHVAASVGEVVVEIPDLDLNYTTLGRVGVELPSKELFESTKDDQVPVEV